MPDTTVKLQDITPVKSTFDNDDQLLLINPTGEARISKEDFLDAMPDDALTLIGDITTTGIEGDTVAKQLGALENSKALAITETTESSAIANFSDGADDMVMHNIVAEINPVQSGSGDPSPSNIRPITGHTEVNVYRTGANLWDEQWEAGGIDPANGNNRSYTTPDTRMRSTNYISVKPSTTYYWTLSGPKVICYYDEDKTFISGGWTSSATFTTPSNAYYIRFSTSDAYGATYQNNISINYPATDTAYHAYAGSTTVSLSWQTEAGTVYGGTIDVATGLLTVTDANIASYAGETLPSTWISDRDVYAQGTTPTTGAQVVYKLATPQTYQLTPQQLKTLLGTNNVWADTGNVSVTYPADTKMFIEKLTMPTEDDLVANQAITSGKYFMIGNSLYLALANIASGAQITIGTNAQRVSLADALNTINS